MKVVIVTGHAAAGRVTAAATGPAGLIGLGAILLVCGLGFAIHGERFIELFDSAAGERRRQKRTVRLSLFVSRRIVPAVFTIGGAVAVVIGVARAIR